ncbi:hypothetical protein [Actinosynnema sp. NPDC020468]|uniref:hypothetical protein n=1 Tax=Actinosynnema sp. NPDC020468 TaxID=3154488 RepID=UPI0033E824D7
MFTGPGLIAVGAAFLAVVVVVGLNAGSASDLQSIGDSTATQSAPTGMPPAKVVDPKFESAARLSYVTTVHVNDFLDLDREEPVVPGASPGAELVYVEGRLALVSEAVQARVTRSADVYLVRSVDASPLDCLRSDRSAGRTLDLYALGPGGLAACVGTTGGDLAVVGGLVVGDRESLTMAVRVWHRVS